MNFNFSGMEADSKAELEEIENSYNQIVNNSGKLIICGINKLFDKNNILTENLYQVNEEVTAYEIVNI